MYCRGRWAAISTMLFLPNLPCRFDLKAKLVCSGADTGFDKWAMTIILCGLFHCGFDVSILCTSVVWARWTMNYFAAMIYILCRCIILYWASSASVSSEAMFLLSLTFRVLIVLISHTVNSVENSYLLLD